MSIEITNKDSPPLDCTSQARRIPGLLWRRPFGQQRPTKHHPVLGTVEYVSQGRSYWWQVERQIVVSRMTRFDSIVDKWTDEEIESAVNFLARFMREEREIREQILEIRIREGTAPESSQIDQSAIRANLDLWMAPWLVDRSSAGRYSVDYDCLDAPNGQLLGAGYIHALVEPDGRVSKAHFNEMFSGFSAEMFRQRIIPAGCGFVENCIADQFITDRIIRFTPDLERLLKQSMVEVESLLREAPNEAHSFLREAIRILRELYDRRCR